MDTCIIHVNYDLGYHETYRSVDVISDNKVVQSYRDGPSPIADYNDAAEFAHENFNVVLLSMSIAEYIHDRGDVELRQFENWKGSRMIVKF